MNSNERETWPTVENNRLPEFRSKGFYGWCTAEPDEETFAQSVLEPHMLLFFSKQKVRLFSSFITLV